MSDVLSFLAGPGVQVFFVLTIVLTLFSVAGGLVLLVLSDKNIRFKKHMKEKESALEKELIAEYAGLQRELRTRAQVATQEYALHYVDVSHNSRIIGIRNANIREDNEWICSVDVENSSMRQKSNLETNDAGAMRQGLVRRGEASQLIGVA